MNVVGQWDAIDMGDGTTMWTDGSSYSGDLYVSQNPDETWTFQVHPYGDPATEITYEAMDDLQALDKASRLAEEYWDHEQGPDERGPKLGM